MKALLFLITFISFNSSLLAQVELTVSHPEKKKFFLFVDGLKENDDARSKVKVKKLQNGPHHLKVIFETPEGSSPQLKVSLEAGWAYEYEIKRYANGKRQWLALNEISKKKLPPKTVKKTQSDILPGTELKEAESKSDSLFQAHLPPANIDQPKDSAEVLNILEDSVAIPKSEMEFQCQNPARPATYDSLRLKLESVDQEANRLEVAAKISEDHCLSAIQIMEMLQLFTQENHKIEFAAHAYSYCFDPMNYHFVEDSFQYEASARELHNRIYATQETRKKKK